MLDQEHVPIKVNDTGNADKMRLVEVDQGPISRAGDPLPVSCMFKEVDIKNRHFPSDFSPKVKIVTPLFYFGNKNFRPFSISYGSRNFEFQKKF